MKRMVQNREYFLLSFLLSFLFLISYFFAGLFHEAVACIFGGMFALIFVIHISYEKKFMFYCNKDSFCVLAIVFCYFISIFFSVDAGMAWIGFLKMLTVFFFFCCVMQLSGQKREQLLSMIPLLGCAMVCVGLLAYILQPLYGYFFMADRFCGFFQYANVFALFCLLGIIILVPRLVETTSKRIVLLSILNLVLLFLGIFLSGSRTVFFLMVAVCLIFVARIKKVRFILGMLLIGVILAVIYAELTGNMQNVGRFLTVSLHSSTFLGRILYAKDGVRLLCKHPFGLGYLGYYFMEPAIQTGVYSIRYIHNDFLQMALDIGIIPTILFTAVFIRNVLRKENGDTHRLLLAVLGVHCMVDFDLEFTSIWFIFLLSLDAYQEGERNFILKGKKKFCQIAVIFSSALVVYTGSAMLPRYFGECNLSVAFIPFYTEAKREILAQETDIRRAQNMANSVLKQNTYIPEAYDILAVVSYQAGDFRAMKDYKWKSLELQKYNIEAYNRMVFFMGKAIETSMANGNTAIAYELMGEVVNVESRLDSVKDTTDSLAYEIRDVPKFALSVEVRDYIAKAKKLMEQM